MKKYERYFKEDVIDVEFEKKDGTLERVSIDAKSKKEFKQKLNKELKARNLDYVDDSDKWFPSKFDRNHKWFQ